MSADTGKKAPRVVRVALVVPHIFMNDGIRERVIFSPGDLALALCDGLGAEGVEVTLFSPGPVAGRFRDVTADMRGFERELAGRGYGCMELMKKHPATFVALARQVQAELVAKAYGMANAGEFDIVHIYTNEEDIAMQFAGLCSAPVLFTHHDPFNFLIKYKSVMPRYKDLNWVSVSMAQRRGMPAGTNWVRNIYHGVDYGLIEPRYEGDSDYVAYVGRIIESKGVHLAISAVKRAQKPLRLVIAGKHYADSSNDKYFAERIAPELGGRIEYVGYLQGEQKLALMRGARALLVPSTFEEPFGMVSLEALACGTPVIGLSAGATAEIVRDGREGYVVPMGSEEEMVGGMVAAIERLPEISRRACRERVEQGFGLRRMVREHAELYRKMVGAGR